VAKMVQITVSVTERQAATIRAEAKRRDVGEGEVVRGVLDFWVDAIAGRVSLYASVFSTPLSSKTSSAA
jgi:hypothetical protein